MTEPKGIALDLFLSIRVNDVYDTYKLRYDPVKIKMNTTDKYINDEAEIAVTHFKEKNIETLEIWIESYEKSTKTIVKKYNINANGRIETLQRFDDEWTAYPPLNFEKSAVSVNSEFKYIESHFWNNIGQLEKVEILNQNSNKLSLRKFKYMDKTLIEVNDELYLKQLVYNSKNILQEVNTTLKIRGLNGQKIQITLFRSERGQVIEKHTKLIFTSDSEPVEMKEHFSYNEYGQITNSIQLGEDEGVTTEIRSTFKYLNQESNNITSIKIEENGKFRNELLYEYTEKGLLNSLTSKNNKGEMTKTIYVRK